MVSVKSGKERKRKAGDSAKEIYDEEVGEREGKKARKEGKEGKEGKSKKKGSR